MRFTFALMLAYEWILYICIFSSKVFLYITQSVGIDFLVIMILLQHNWEDGDICIEYHDHVLKIYGYRYIADWCFLLTIYINRYYRLLSWYIHRPVVLRLINLFFKYDVVFLHTHDVGGWMVITDQISNYLCTNLCIHASY